MSATILQQSEVSTHHPRMTSPTLPPAPPMILDAAATATNATTTIFIPQESSKSSTGTTDTTATAKGSYQHLVPQGITLWHMVRCDPTYAATQAPATAILASTL
jgi:hypothetical protein